MGKTRTARMAKPMPSRTLARTARTAATAGHATCRRRRARRRRRRPGCLSVSSVARPTHEGASRSITTALGALSATTPGALTMRMSSVGASASALPFPHPTIAAHLGAARAASQSIWTISHARDRRQGWSSAVTADGEATTAVITKTLPSFAPWVEYPFSRLSERRIARISRTPRGAIADWEEGPLSSGSGRRHAWDSRPTGRYRNLGSF